MSGRDPLAEARERRSMARLAMAEADAASARLREAHRRALSLLGGTETAPALSEIEAIHARMRDIERRMRDSERMMRAAEAGIAADTSAASGRDVDGSGSGDA